MRASQWILGLATASAIVASIASGCGGSSTSNTPAEAGADATNDVATEAATKEAAAETGPADAASEACAVDADLSTIPIPDASIGDSGVNAGACVTCVEAACPNLISDCNALCSCKTAFIQFETCIAGGGSLTSCGPDLLNSGLPTSDLTCAVGCASTCGFQPPSDGGGEGGAGEAGGDAAGDAAGD